MNASVDVTSDACITLGSQTISAVDVAINSYIRTDGQVCTINKAAEGMNYRFATDERVGFVYMQIKS